MADINITNVQKDQHAYSCKRCRRLKKKCTRTIPICLNCSKAGEACEYVPRAPRRKKLEILKSANQLKTSNNGNVPLAPNGPTKESSNNAAYNTNYNSLNQYNSTTANPTPNIVSSNLLNLTPSPSPYQQFPMIPRTRSASVTSNTSLRQLNYGTTDPFSYTQIENFNFSGLPPISSITSSVNGSNNLNGGVNVNSLNTNNQNGSSSQSTNNDFAALAQGFNFNSNSIHQNLNSFSNNQFPFHKIPSSVPSPKSSISSVDSSLIRRIIPNTNSTTANNSAPNNVTLPTNDSAQNRMLHSVMGISNRTGPPPEIPEFSRSLILQCADSYFHEFARHYPFLNKADCLERIEAIDLERLNSMNAADSYETYMVLLIGYCSLERREKIPTDKALKDYLNYKSLDQLSYILDYEEPSSIRQLLFLGIYSFFEESGNTSWNLSGMLTKLALSLGLNRKPMNPNYSETSEEEWEYRKRLFWSVYSFDRQCAIALNRPVGIDDDDISLSFLNVLPYEDAIEIRLINTILDLRRIEGLIQKKVHSVSASTRYNTPEAKANVLDELRKEVEGWYSRASDFNMSNRKASLTTVSVSWYSASYYQMLLLLYKPSFLFPHPTKEVMEVVGKACLQSIAYTFNLYQIHMVPLFWTHLYRLMSIFTPLVHCLVTNSVELAELKTELTLAIEICEYYCSKWSLALEVVNILNQINHTILDANLGYGFDARQKEELTRKLVLFAHQYLGSLNSSKIDIWHDDPLVSSILAIDVN